MASDQENSDGRSAPRKSPDAFRTISEVSDELTVPQHVLRFWESKFTQIRPLKRGGRRRYYRPEDVLLLRGIRRLLYEDGYTIKGVQKVLKERGVRSVANGGREEGAVPAASPAPAPSLAAPLDAAEIVRDENQDGINLQRLLAELDEIRGMLTR
ncbi:MerR family transcriptional regulator [Emcibacter sp. SYSU 3D8]|uniref:MerR family transcriptional regulator n=1 Tax=Emcibacter sp. SYSU 3D8 TaxID=3133969 RepID=UPI0031FE787E